MANPADTHSRLAREFVMMAGHQTQSQAELMVVIETTMLASLKLLTALYGQSPAHASIFMEAALQRATERYVAPEGDAS